MEGSSTTQEFPGFQICIHKDEFEYRRFKSRLQRRAPCPLQIMPSTAPAAWDRSENSKGGDSRSAVAYSTLDSFLRSKDPIPLLSPLVLPIIESTCTRDETTSKSH